MLTLLTDSMLGDVPDGWTVEPLKKLLLTHSPGDWGSEHGPTMVSVLRSTNITNDGSLNFSDVARRSIRADWLPFLEPKKDDILLERSGGGPDQPVGRVGFIEQDLPGFAFSNFLHLLRPDSGKIHPRFLGWMLYLVNRSGRVLRLEQQTTQMRNLHFRDYLTMPLPVPPPAEQAAIARILDAAAGAIARTRTAIERIEKLRRGLIERFVRFGLNPPTVANPTLPEGWENVRLGNWIDDGPTNGMYRPESDYGDDGNPIIRIDSFADGVVHGISSLRRVRLIEAERQRYPVEHRDILINRVNSLSHIGKAALVPPVREVTVFESNMMRLRMKDGLLSEYVILVLCSSIARAHWLTRAKPAVNQASINQRDVRDLRFPKPPVPVQEQIVEIVNAVTDFKLSFLKQKSLQDRVRRGLMQDLLTGRTRIRTSRDLRPGKFELLPGITA